MMSFFALALLAKLTVILAAGLLVTALLRSAAPSLRHLVVLATLACGLTLPVIMILSPSWEVRVLPGSVAPAATSLPQSPASVRSGAGETRQVAPRSPAQAAASQSPAMNASPDGTTSRRRTLNGFLDRRETLLPLIWAFGFVIVVAWLVVGRVRLRRIARAAWPLVSPDWQTLLAEACAEAEVPVKVHLFSSPVVSTPLTWGSLSPVILLPEDALDWSEEHRRVVLRHELAHIARKDSFSQLVTGFICSLYWFHPLVWMSERRLRAECERACDDRVVSLGTPAPEYASHLLEVARSARALGAPSFLSVAMARPSQLEGRLLAVLNGSRRPAAISRTAKVVTCVLCALVILPLAAFRPVPRRASDASRLARVFRPTLVEYGPSLIVPAGVTSEKAPKIRPAEVVISNHADADTIFQLSAPARDGGTLDLDLRTGGEITITSWDRAEVFVRASLGGRDWRETRVTLEPRNGAVILESDFIRGSTSQSTRHHFDIQVPRNFNVRVKSAGGSVSIANVAGRFSGSTGGGEITIQNANGEADIRTGGGEIRVSDSNLSGSVSTGGGQIRIVRVNGNLRGHSGSGPVIYADSPDPRIGSGVGIGAGQSGTTINASGTRSSAIRMSSAGGALSLPSAPNGAKVTTGGGRIHIGPSGGEVYAQTGGGPIDIGPATGSVKAHTGAGDVDIELKGAGSHEVDVTSGTGQVVIVAPSDLNATLELETAYTNNFGRKTRIVSDWPVSISETSSWDDSHGTPRKYVRVRQNIGRGGGLIRVSTVNGDVILKRVGP